MILICPCCGAECGDRDQANERCGKCGSFFTGSEKVIAASTAQDATVVWDDHSPSAASTNLAPPTASVSNDDVETPGQSPPPMMAAGSEELVRPRRLSPQFRRHVEMTWQPSVAAGGVGADRTLSSNSSSNTTKLEHSTLRIGTRKITPDHDKGSGDYELNEVIGEGSMGQVWSARQTSLDRAVAVKVPKQELAKAGSVGESQFISEVVVTGKLEHPNIVPIYELGRDTQGVPFYSMKHVQGRAWNEVLEEKSEQENIEILMKVCDAIAFAHDRDFLHRDIKPHNVMVGEFGEVSVMDWGIAVSLSKDPQRAWAAVASGPAGTPAYMAPEMAAYNPSELGVVSDIYLLGAVLYEIVTSTPPHPRTGETNEALLAAAANEIIPTDKTGELVDIARRAMATKPEDRYQRVQEFQDALRKYQSHRESIALAESADEHLALARREGSSDKYARARFAYEEAIKLWSGNALAVAGLQASTIAYATNALEQGNYPLGLSILDPKEPSHRQLRSQLQVRQLARERKDLQNRILSYSVVLLIAILGLGGMFAAFYLNTKRNEAVRAEKDAVDAKDQAVEAKNQANQARDQADAAQRNANDQKEKALAAKDQADAARNLATLERSRAEEQRHRAEEAAYRSDIGLAAESIRRDSFDIAKEIVDALDTGVKSKLRHWEWAYMQYLLNRSSLRNLPGTENGELVEAVTVAELPTDGSSPKLLFAAGSNLGIRLWEKTQDNGPKSLSNRIEGFGVTALALSHDGQFLVAGVSAADEPGQHRLKVWTVKDGELVDEEVLCDGCGEVHSVAFSSDDRLVLIASEDRTATLWNFTNRKQVLSLPVFVFDDHAGPVWSAQFSPDNQRIVTACGDGRVRVWTTTGQQLADFVDHQGPVYSAAFLGNESIVSGGDDRRLLAWRLTMTPEEFGAYRKEAVTVAIEGNGLVTSPYDVKEIGRHDASIRCIRIANDGQFILSGSHDNSLKVWPSPEGVTPTRQPTKHLRGHGRWVRACAISPDGKYLVSGGHDGAKLWNWQKYEIPHVLAASFAVQIGSSTSVESAPTEVTNATYSPDGNWIASALRNGTVAIWNMRQPEQVIAQRLGNGHRFLTSTAVFFDAGKSLMTSAGDDTTRLWNVSRSVQTHQFAGTGWRGVAAISRDGRLVLSGSDNKQIPARIWFKIDDEWQEVPLRLEHFETRQSHTPSETSAVALSEDGRFGLVGDSSGHCFLLTIDPASQVITESRDFPGHAAAITAARFIPSEEMLITAGADGVLRKWQLPSATLLQELRLRSSIKSLALSSDGNMALVASSPTLRQDPPRPWDIPVVQLVDTLRFEVIEGKELMLEQIDKTALLPPVVKSVVFSPDNSSAILTIYYPDGKPQQGISKWTWAPSAGSNPTSKARWGNATAAFFRPLSGADLDAELLTVGGKGARLWNVVNETSVASTPVAVFQQQPSVLGAAFSHDSQRLVTAGSDGTATIWELEGNQWNQVINLVGQHAQQIVSVMFDPQSADRLLTASPDKSGTAGKLVIWEKVADEMKWQPQYKLTTDATHGALFCALFSPHTSDDTRMIVAGLDHAAIRWNWKDVVAENLAPKPFLDSRVKIAAFSADGTWLVTAKDSTAQILNADRLGEALLQPLAILTGHAGEVTSLAISSDRRRILTGSVDRTVKLWDTDEERLFNVKELMTLEQHDDEITSVAFSPNGRNVLTASKDGRAIVWAGEAVPPSIKTEERVLIKNGESGYVAASAILQSPTQADFAAAQLTVFVKDVEGRPAERLPGLIEVADHQGWLVTVDATATTSLTISPATAVHATREDFQRLLQNITFLYEPKASKVEFSTGLESTIVFRLTGVRDAEGDPARQPMSKAEFPAVEAEVKIEIGPPVDTE